MKTKFIALVLSVFALSLAACSNEKDKAVEALQAEIVNINAELPMEIDQITVWDSCSVTNDNYIYHYTLIDTEEGEIYKLMQENIAEQKESITQALKESPEFVQDALPLLEKAGVSLVYEYTSSTNGKKIDITFTPEEVSQF